MVSWLSKRVEAAARLALARWGPAHAGTVIVNEFPRSGGTWLGELLAECLGLEFPRNRIPRTAECILHGHYINLPSNENTVVVWRDGRDVMVSYYFYSLFVDGQGLNQELVRRTRRRVPFEDYSEVRTNLAAFIETIYTNPPAHGFTWSEFVQKWVERPVVTATYEDLLADTPAVIAKVVSRLGAMPPSSGALQAIVDRNSFKRRTGRVPGEEKIAAFRRKGVAGDWVRYFDRRAREVFESYAGEELRTLGYTRDRRWTQSA